MGHVSNQPFMMSNKVTHRAVPDSQNETLWGGETDPCIGKDQTGYLCSATGIKVAQLDISHRDPETRI